MAQKGRGQDIKMTYTHSTQSYHRNSIHHSARGRDTYTTILYNTQNSQSKQINKQHKSYNYCRTTKPMTNSCPFTHIMHSITVELKDLVFVTHKNTSLQQLMQVNEKFFEIKRDI